MSFRCTACFDKSYDKAWKLQRHIRESRKCSEQLNPGISRVRFKCWSCDYTSPREDDLRRHRRRIHPDIAIATGTETEEAGQPMVGSYETPDVAPCLQPVNPPDVNERSDEIEQFDPHPASESTAAIIKRKTSDPDDLAPDHKRVCTESVLIDLDTLRLVDDSDAREASTPKTADNEDLPSLTIQQPTSGKSTALVASTSSAKLQSAPLFGAPQSMSICGSSIGSLFGRTSIHIPEIWMAWSSIPPPPASSRSLHSIGMPAPMLGSVDEELSLSRAGNDLGEPRYWNDGAIEAFVTEHSLDLNADCEDVHAPRGVPCIFRLLACPQIFTDLDEWTEHCKNHFNGKALPGQLHCPYKSCGWATTTQDGEDAWNQRRKHFDQEHDILSQSEELSEEPDVPLFQHLWCARDLPRRLFTIDVYARHHADDNLMSSVTWSVTLWRGKRLTKCTPRMKRLKIGSKDELTEDQDDKICSCC